MKKACLVVCKNVLSKPLPLSEIKAIKEAKKRRRLVGKIFEILHYNTAKKVTNCNMILLHEEYKSFFDEEIEKTGTEFELSKDYSLELYKLSLWRLVRDGFLSYIDLEKSMFITRRASEFSLLEKIRICLGAAPLSVDALFRKLELPMIWFPKYETMLKHMEHYKRVNIEDGLISINRI